MLTPRKRKTLVVSALAVAAVVAGIRYHYSDISSPVGSAQAADAPPAVEVDVATVVSESVTEWQSYSGRIEAVDHVDVRPLVAGTIVAVHFKDGALVKKGDPLFTIDPRPYQTEVDKAAAQLAAARARATYASTDAARADRLLADNAIAKRDYDEKQNAARTADAEVKAAEAALEGAQVDLGYTRIVSPITGRASRAELTIGNVVAAGTSAPVLTTLVSVSPVYASFNVDEQTYLQYLGRDREATVPVSLGLANETGYSRKGTVASVDNRLDTASGTIRVRARFDNNDGTLVPGLYARVKVGGGAAHPAVMVEDSAIGTDQAKKYVLVVNNTNTVQYREVQLGALHDALRIVSAGLAPGERIVVNGIQRVRPNDLVKVHEVQMVDLADNTGTAKAGAKSDAKSGS